MTARINDAATMTPRTGQALLDACAGNPGHGSEHFTVGDVVTIGRSTTLWTVAHADGDYIQLCREQLQGRKATFRRYFTGRAVCGAAELARLTKVEVSA